jgi:hypothetical protein
MAIGRAPTQSAVVVAEAPQDPVRWLPAFLLHMAWIVRERKSPEFYSRLFMPIWPILGKKSFFASVALRPGSLRLLDRRRISALSFNGLERRKVEKDLAVPNRRTRD